MLAKLQGFWELLKETGEEFAEDHATKLSASLAYYTIFSIGPLLLVLIHILGLIYKKKEASKLVLGQIGQFTGPRSAKQLENILNNLDASNSSTLFGVIGIVVFVFSATSIFTEIQSTINYLWSVQARPERSWLKYLRDRALSFLLIVGGGAVMVASLTLNVVVDMITGQIESFSFIHEYFGGVNFILIAGINTGVLFLIVTFLFAVIFKVLPDANMHWKDIIVGASFTGVLFLIGKFLITWYLSTSTLISAYGAAASLIILLSWIYYSALILYFGAEFTDVYARKCGRGVSVRKNAVFIIKRDAKELPSLATHTDEDLG